MAIRSDAESPPANAMKLIAELDLSFFGRKRVPVLLQSELAECGLACVAMVARFHGLQIDLNYLRRQCAASVKGLSLSQLMELCQFLALTPRALRLEPESVRDLTLPCLLHWNMDHFVVLEKVSKRGLSIVDPATGRRVVTPEEFGKNFTGVALELTPAEGFRTDEQSSSFRLSHLLRGTPGLAAALSQILAFSLAIQVFALALPFYSQIVIDEVIVSRDLDLLNLLFVAFFVLVVVQTAVSAFRSWVVVYVGMKIRLNWASRIFSHLIRLPMRYFGARHIGDIQSRYRSLDELQELISTKVVESIVDGLMTATTIIVLYLFDALLATIVIASTALYLAIHLMLLPTLRTRSQEAIMASARRDSHFLESIRGFLTIKNFGLEHRRESSFLSRTVESINQEIPVVRLNVVTSVSSQFLYTIQFLIVVYVAAGLVTSGEFTVGMLVAFLAFRAQFSERSAELVNKLIEFRVARVHLDRLSDIVETEIETDLSVSARQGSSSQSPIRLIEAKDVWFRYARTDPYTLQAVNFDVSVGEFVAVTGASGLGKTTLLKVLMGLYSPDKGVLTIDGKSLDEFGLRNYREKYAAVMQDDSLLAGTLAENISLFDPDLDMDHLHHCAERAAIASDILGMPMQYFTLVGDMGAALSGGQRQRILIARALYKRPEILFLDEAGSHLDSDNERRIVNELRDSGITVVSIAHRSESIEQADRVIRMESFF